MLTGDTLERFAHNSAIRDLSKVPDFLVKDTFVSEDQVLICIEILVPTESLVVDTAWVRENRGVAQLAHQTRECEPVTEWMGVVSVKEGRTVVPSEPDNSKLGIGRPVAFQSPSVLRKDTSKPVKFTLVKDVGVQSALPREKLGRAKTSN